MLQASNPSISKALQEHLSSGTTTLCHCWQIHRCDGQIMGFCDHDRSIVFDGITHDPETGFDAGALERSSGLSVDNSRAIGAISADVITETDLKAGKYDGARFALWRVNWRTPEQRSLRFSGELGEASYGALGFEVELRGLMHRLNQPVGRIYAPDCDAAFGDRRCGIDLADYTAQCTLLHGDTQRLVIEPPQSLSLTMLESGIVYVGEQTRRIRLAQEIMLQSNGQSVKGVEIYLWRALSEQPSPSIMIKIIAGCNRQFSTCLHSYQNTENFRGFPHMPGNDWVLRAPSHAEQNQGGSLYAAS